MSKSKPNIHRDAPYAVVKHLGGNFIPVHPPSRFDSMEKAEARIDELLRKLTGQDTQDEFLIIKVKGSFTLKLKLDGEYY